MRAQAMSNELLRVEDLRISFPVGTGRLAVVDGVSFSLRPGEMVGIVGESGAGKSMTALAIMNLVRSPGRIDHGRVWFKGEDLLTKTESELRHIRGSQIAMVFQSLRSSLNPLMKVGDQVARVYQLHHGLSRAEARQRAIEMLQRVGIPDPVHRAHAYPHQLSGGMAQRVMIAMMVASHPDLLIADEPTTGLDVTIQAQIFDLIKEIQHEMGTTVLLITHDLGLVAELCDRVILLYAGQIAEIGTVQQVFTEPAHPYSRYLLDSILRVDEELSFSFDGTEDMSYTSPYQSRGCRFYHRCAFRQDVCFTDPPTPQEIAPQHEVRCHMHGRLPWNPS